MKKMVIILLIVAVAGFVGCGKSDKSRVAGEAVAAAEAWLVLVDGEKYIESWDDAAPFFKGAVKSEQWIQMMQSVRKPLGKNVSRKYKSSQSHTSMPGAPDGEYVVVRFKSSFENKKSAVEVVTPMLDKDGEWRVAGYFIK